MNNSNFLEIDGSFGEGGGAILRVGAGFSILQNQPIIIKSIRANRPKPGLRMQHLLGLKTLADLTSSELSNCTVGSREISLTPGQQIKPKTVVNISTAASIGLLLQPIQIASMGFNKPDLIEIYLSGGGTFGQWAPSINYLQRVTYNILKKAGLDITLNVEKEGWYPKGGAKVTCSIKPARSKLRPINITELGNVGLIQGDITISNQLRRPRDNIATRTKKAAVHFLKRSCNIETDIKFDWVDSTSPGVGISLWAESDSGAVISSGTLLGEKNISSEKLGEMAASELLKYIQNDIPVDDYLSDQLIPLMAYVQEPSRIKVLEITSHAKTNLDLIKLFTKREFNIIKEKNHFYIEYQ